MRYELLKSVTMTFAIIPLCLISFVFWKLYTGFKGTQEICGNRITMTITVLLFLVYPSINDNIFNALK
jgi:hypothetical protein